MLERIFKAGGIEPAIVTFKTMRRAIGILGIALPMVLFAWSVLFCGGCFLLDSISAYYHTAMRDFFVGILCAVALFLLAFHGFDLADFIAFKLAGASALGVAFFPALAKGEPNSWVHAAWNATAATTVVHYVSAAVFFLTLAFVSAFLFTRSSAGKRRMDLPPQKRRRNAVYLGCGIAILACVLLLLAANLLPDSSPILRANPVFWIETVALLAFGASWLVKGETLFRDR